jgi:hypothetical protein
MKPGAEKRRVREYCEANSRASFPLHRLKEVRLLLFEPIVTME